MDLKYLIKQTNKHFDCDIKNKTQQRDVVMARGAYYWAARHTASTSFHKIGKAVGKHHATVLHTLNNFEDWLRFDDVFNSKFQSFKVLILSEYERENLTAETMLYKYNSMLIENDILKKEIKKLKRL